MTGNATLEEADLDPILEEMRVLVRAAPAWAALECDVFFLWGGIGCWILCFGVGFSAGRGWASLRLSGLLASLTPSTHNHKLCIHFC